MPKRASRFARASAILRYFRARRALVPFVASVAYVVAVGAHVDHGASGRPWLLGLPALVCAFLAAGPTLPGNGLRDDGEREVGLLAYAVWTFALVLASLDARDPDLWQDLCGGGAACASSIVGARAIARIRGGRGIAESLPRPRASLLAVTALMLLVAFGIAIVTSVRALEHASVVDRGQFEHLPHDAHALAAGAALAILAGSLWETLRLSRLVLDAGDRAFTALGVVMATALVAGGLLLLGEGATDRVLRAAVAVAVVLVTFACTAGDAETLARRGRRAIALVIFGGPIVLLGALAAEGPGRSATAFLVTGLVALLVGSAIAVLELPFRRGEGHLLDAVEAARSALVRADPDSSVRDALAALRTFSGLSTQSPELWSLAPSRVMTIDGAGYTRERDAQVPPLLLEIAEQEPEATLRTELLEVLVVRRPDLRPLTRWMDERGALSATLITREGEVQGVLILPRGARKAPMSLEEARAIKRLADAFAGASAAHAALERSLERERLATVRANDLEGRLVARTRIERWVGERDAIVTARLAEPAAFGPYSPVARVAFEAMERRAQRSAPLVVVAPNGADVVSYMARLHLAGPRAAHPFVVVDGASMAYHEVARWIDPATSPLALSDRGALVVEDGMRLPHSVQRVVGDAIAHRRAPWAETESLDICFAMTARSSSARTSEEVAPAMAAMLEDALDDDLLVRWPHLHERGEDLRSMVLAMLGREGLSVRGTALGIEDAAYELLADYGYPGEDAELRSIVQRLALVAEGDVVRAADVVKLGLVGVG